MTLPTPYDIYTDIGLVGCLTIEELFNGSSIARAVFPSERQEQYPFPSERPTANTHIAAWQERFVGMPGKVMGRPAGYVEAHYFAEALYTARRAKG